MEKQTLYTEQIKTKGTTYFLDLKSSERAGPYLVLTQSQKERDGNFNSQRIRIFSSDLNEFEAAFGRMVDSFKQQLPRQESSQANSKD